MRRSTSALVALAAAWAAGSGPGVAGAEPPRPEVTRLLNVAETVLGHHIDPPARQQMVLSGLRAAFKAAGRPEPEGLARQVSDAPTERLPALLSELWPEPTTKPGDRKPEDAATQDLGRAAVEGALAAVEGRAEWIPAKDRKVQEQFEGNLYVGLQIALSAAEKGNPPVISEAIKGGPADKAGIKSGDAIVTIEGVPTTQLPLGEVVDRLRGEEGSYVEIGIRSKGEADVRTLRVVRGRLPRETVEGFAKASPDDEWDFAAKGDRRVAYLRIKEVNGSTPREVRVLAERLQSRGYRGLVLDLRGTNAASFHATTILADDLLDGGMIGQVRTPGRVETFAADADSVFTGWPLAVLVSNSTASEAAWLAAALQYQGRAVVGGEPAGGDGLVRSLVTVSGGGDALRMSTGRLERADGRPIGVPGSPAKRQEFVVRGTLAQDPGAGIVPDLGPKSPSRRQRPTTAPPADPQTRLNERLEDTKADAALDLAIEHVRTRLNAAAH